MIDAGKANALASRLKEAFLAGQVASHAERERARPDPAVRELAKELVDCTHEIVHQLKDT